jgi:hypothetical protein
MKRFFYIQVPVMVTDEKPTGKKRKLRENAIELQIWGEDEDEVLCLLASKIEGSS